MPGYHGDNQNPKFLREKAYEIGYPVLIKAIAGGGGRGMRRVDAHVEFDAALESAIREAEAAFGDGRVLIEKYIASPRHIELQVFADTHGGCVHLYERDCSAQRRHQKVVEECPAPGLPEETRAAMAKAATEAALAAGYVGAGTVEFIADPSRGLKPSDFYFLEMNTRLQVEHPVTEAVTGLDLVEWQFRVAAGEPLPLKQSEIACAGAAIEARVYAEDPEHNFLPSAGLIHAMNFKGEEGVRIDTGFAAGDSVTPYYDPMIAKVIVHGATRAEALAALLNAARRRRHHRAEDQSRFPARAPAQSGVRGRNDRHRLHRRQSRAPWGSAASAEQKGRPRRRAASARAARRGQAVARLTRSTRGGSPIPSSSSVRAASASTSPSTASPCGCISSRAPMWIRSRRTRAEDGDEVTLHEANGGVYAFAGGRQAFVELVDPFAKAEAGAEEGDAAIRAPMNGRLVAVAVEDGDTVEAGQRLAVVEAMKMEHALVAPMRASCATLTRASASRSRWASASCESKTRTPRS